ncbi:MAG TPA: hypothetical protein VMZ00_05965 [Sporichthya sp.]|nr:hypothetical protein [Sporichthya sp.]
MRARLIRVPLAASVLLAMWAAPAGAAGPEGPVAARCGFSYAPAISPGIGMAPGAGTVSSGGESGTVDCTGSLDGHEITGPGTWGFEGVVSRASCAEGGEGTGLILMTVPTDAGSQHFEEAIDFAFGPAGTYPPLVGDWVGQRTTGIYVVTPAEGDCVTAPVTRVDGNGRLELHGR